MNTQTPINQPRRADRAITDETRIKAMLHSAPFGMLATEWQGQPFIKPTLFSYDEAGNALYFHGALEGRTQQNIAANPRVSFCLSKMGRLLPADTAMEFGMEYESVVVFGRVRFVAQPEEAQRALQLLLDKYFPHLKPGEDYRGVTPEELEVTAVYRLDIEQWSGKAAHARNEYPGAFYYEDLAGHMKR